MHNDENIESTARQIFDRDEVDGVLKGSFYSASKPDPTLPSVTTDQKKKPTHYKVICISMYTDALGRLDDMVLELKARGYTKANRSALIRHALDVVDLDSVPRGL
ncbi:MAG: hypothetical protein JRI68_13255 [Deltaproteobacteria bacterium]|nr:hypothetical protein [Deltaproteobacteria bacterium]